MFNWLIFKQLNLYISAMSCLCTLQAACNTKSTQPGRPAAHIPACFAGSSFHLNLGDSSPGHRSGLTDWCSKGPCPPSPQHPIHPSLSCQAVKQQTEQVCYLLKLVSSPPATQGILIPMACRSSLFSSPALQIELVGSVWGSGNWGQGVGQCLQGAGPGFLVPTGGRAVFVQGMGLRSPVPAETGPLSLGLGTGGWRPCQGRGPGASGVSRVHRGEGRAGHICSGGQGSKGLQGQRQAVSMWGVRVRVSSPSRGRILQFGARDRRVEAMSR